MNPFEKSRGNCSIELVAAQISETYTKDNIHSCESARCQGTVKNSQVSKLTELSVMIVAKGSQELSLSSCCVTGPCKNVEQDMSPAHHYFLSNIQCESEKKKIKELYTYTFWTAFRFAKDDDMSPLRPLKDRFLQNTRYGSV